MKRHALTSATLFCLSLATGCALLQPASSVPTLDDAGLAALLESRADLFGDVLAAADEHRIKVELAVVAPGAGGPTLVRASYDRGPTYFYPASSVKTCAAIAAIRRLAEVRAATGEMVGIHTPLRFHPLFDDDVMDESDPSHVADGTITAGHDMRKVFLVSDNGAYNHLYELAGNELVNDEMRRAGLMETRILHRLSEFRSADDQLRTPRVDLLNDDGQVLAALPRRSSPFAETNSDLAGTVFGTAHTQGDTIVDGPMSFARKNYMPLRDLLDMNVMLLRPDVEVDRDGFQMLPIERAFIRDAMASTPGASKDPVYDPATYAADYSKFLLPGLLRFREAGEVTVRDKVGRAYGFSTTNSEVIDARTGRTFFVAATIYTNPNDVVGDGVYDYDRADAFFADLGEVLGRYVFAD